MVSPPLLDLILYARPGCGLCDEARVTIGALMAARREAGLPTPTLVERDIDTDPAWHAAFFSSIPVVELGERRIELATSPARLRRLLSETLDGVPA
ncbi:MAG: glutaredoxin family protein [Chloroflexi bacterium]|nr:glutaredoxin family protein [Chloroflexota bacterium]